MEAFVHTLIDNDVAYFTMQVVLLALVSFSSVEDNAKLKAEKAYVKYLLLTALLWLAWGSAGVEFYLLFKDGIG